MYLFMREQAGGKQMKEGSKLQRADKARTQYVNRLSEKGIRLSLTDNSHVIFRTETDKVVGIPSASFDEKRGPEGGWWMGLPNEYFDFIILLCQRDADTPLDFVLPRSFFLSIWKDDLHWEWLSSGWRVQFDVRQRNGDFELKLKGRKRVPENLQGFLGKAETLAG
jgi:hypothetical protein